MAQVGGRQTRFCDVIEESPRSGGGVATASRVFFNFSIICLKFGIKLVPLLSGQSSLFDDPNLNFLFMGPLRKHVTKYQSPKQRNTNRRSFLGNLSFVPLLCRISLNFRFGWIRKVLSSQIKGFSDYFTGALSLPNEFCVRL